MRAALVGIAFAVCSGVLAVLVNSPGRLPPLRDPDGRVIEGSISEKVFIEAGGIRQGLFIRGENPQNPVILYLHGGPGTPMLQFIDYLEKTRSPAARLEQYFTVCYWDQRGSGMTYTGGADPSSMTVEQMVEDTREVTSYLRERFGQEKIYLLGHSWGTYLGVKTVEKYPELYLAYVGIGQTVNLTESERLSYRYMLAHARAIGDQDAVDKLTAFDPDAQGFPLMPDADHLLDYLLVRTQLLNRYGIGHLHDTKLLRGMPFNVMVARALFGFRGYTAREKVNWFLGADFSMVRLFPVLQQDNLFESSVRFEVPFYLVHGDYDYQVSGVDAPKKGFFPFSDSAHSPNLEEPERFVGVLRLIASENPPV